MHDSRLLRRAIFSGRWAPEDRNYPETKCWFGVVDLFRKFTETFTSAELLVRLSLGKVSQCRFSSSSISELKKAIVDQGRLNGYELRRAVGDRNDVTDRLPFHGPDIENRGRPGNRTGRVFSGSTSWTWRPHVEVASTTPTETTLATPRTGRSFEYMDEHPNSEVVWSSNLLRSRH